MSAGRVRMVLRVMSMLYTEQALEDMMSYPARRNPHLERVAEELDTGGGADVARGDRCL